MSERRASYSTNEINLINEAALSLTNFVATTGIDVGMPIDWIATQEAEGYVYDWLTDELFHPIEDWRDFAARWIHERRLKAYPEKPLPRFGLAAVGTLAILMYRADGRRSRLDRYMPLAEKYLREFEYEEDDQ